MTWLFLASAILCEVTATLALKRALDPDNILNPGKIVPRG